MSIKKGARSFPHFVRSLARVCCRSAVPQPHRNRNCTATATTPQPRYTVTTLHHSATHRSRTATATAPPPRRHRAATTLHHHRSAPLRRAPPPRRTAGNCFVGSIPTSLGLLSAPWWVSSTDHDSTTSRDCVTAVRMPAVWPTLPATRPAYRPNSPATGAARYAAAPTSDRTPPAA